MEYAHGLNVIGSNGIIDRTDEVNTLKSEVVSLRAGQSFLLCTYCNGTGHIDDDGRESNCRVCDGNPKITLAVVAEYARQIDALRATQELAITQFDQLAEDYSDLKKAKEQVETELKSAMAIASAATAAKEAAEAACAVMASALQEVEWVWDYDRYEKCPWCDKHRDFRKPDRVIEKHSPDCLRQKALKSNAGACLLAELEALRKQVEAEEKEVNHFAKENLEWARCCEVTEKKLVKLEPEIEALRIELSALKNRLLRRKKVSGI